MHRNGTRIRALEASYYAALSDEDLEHLMPGIFAELAKLTPEDLDRLIAGDRQMVAQVQRALERREEGEL